MDAGFVLEVGGLGTFCRQGVKVPTGSMAVPDGGRTPYKLTRVSY